MAWGFWTTYNVHMDSISSAAARRSRLQLAASSNSTPPQPIVHSNDITRRSWEQLEMQKIEGQQKRMAYERHLLLGEDAVDEPWNRSNNTLPRNDKKIPPASPIGCLSRTDSSSLYVVKQNNNSDDSDESKKSDDDELFCPACHRVSFGSMTSSRDESVSTRQKSTTTSRGDSPADFKGPPLSSSLPTPPPPPPILFATTKKKNQRMIMDFYSQEDLTSKNSVKQQKLSGKRYNASCNRNSKESIRRSSSRELQVMTMLDRNNPNTKKIGATLPRPRSVSLGNRRLLIMGQEEDEDSEEMIKSPVATQYLIQNNNEEPRRSRQQQQKMVSVRSSHSLFETTSSRSLSSRSGKSSSSRTPSIEKLKEVRSKSNNPGCGSSKCKKYSTIGGKSSLS